MKRLHSFALFLFSCLALSMTSVHSFAQSFPWGEPDGRTLHTSVFLELDGGSFAVNREGTSCLVWTETTDSTVQLRAQSLNDSNEPIWGDNGVLLIDRAPDQDYRLHAFPDGDWAVTWQESVYRWNHSEQEPHEQEIVFLNVIRLSPDGTVRWQRQLEYRLLSPYDSLYNVWPTEQGDLCLVLSFLNNPDYFFRYDVYLLDVEGNLPWGNNPLGSFNRRPIPDEQGRILQVQGFSEPDPYFLVQLYDRTGRQLLGHGPNPDGIRLDHLSSANTLTADGRGGFYSYSITIDHKLILDHFTIQDSVTLLQAAPYEYSFDVNDPSFSNSIRVTDGEAYVFWQDGRHSSIDSSSTVYLARFSTDEGIIRSEWDSATEFTYRHAPSWMKNAVPFPDRQGGTLYLTSDSRFGKRKLARVDEHGEQVDQMLEMPISFQNMSRAVVRGDTLHLAWRGETEAGIGIWKGMVRLSQMEWIGEPVQIRSVSKGRVVTAASRMLDEIVYTAFVETMADTMRTAQLFVVATDIETGELLWEQPRPVSERIPVYQVGDIDVQLEWIDAPETLLLRWVISTQYPGALQKRSSYVQRIDRDGQPLWGNDGTLLLETNVYNDFHHLPVLTTSYNPDMETLVSLVGIDDESSWSNNSYQLIGVDRSGQIVDGADQVPGLDIYDEVIGIQALRDNTFLLAFTNGNLGHQIQLLRLNSTGGTLWDEPRMIDYYNHGAQTGLALTRLHGDLVLFRLQENSYDLPYVLQKCVIDEDNLESFEADDVWLDLDEHDAWYSDLEVVPTDDGGFWLQSAPQLSSSEWQLRAQRYSATGELLDELEQTISHVGSYNPELGVQLVMNGDDGIYQGWQEYSSRGYLRWRSFTEIPDDSRYSGEFEEMYLFHQQKQILGFQSDGRNGVLVDWLKDSFNSSPEYGHGGLKLIRFNNGADLSVMEDLVEHPFDWSLAPAWPNPFNSTIRFQYTLPVTGVCSVTIYDILGQEVARLQDGVLTAGQHSASWGGVDRDGRRVGSGIYFIHLVQNQNQTTQKVILVK